MGDEADASSLAAVADSEREDDDCEKSTAHKDQTKYILENICEHQKSSKQNTDNKGGSETKKRTSTRIWGQTKMTPHLC